MTNGWMVRAGRGSRYFDDFRNRNLAAVGWKAVGDLSKFKTRRELTDRVRSLYSDYTDQMASTAAGQIFRFANEIQIGDRIVTYDGRARSYLCGAVAGNCVHDATQEIDGLTNWRPVHWEKEMPRDNLSQAARNSLGSILTLFLLPSPVSAELWQERDAASKDAAQTAKSQHIFGLEAEGKYTSSVLFEAGYSQIEEQAAEKIKDRVAALGWEEMQELVAGLLRAMGYVTEISPPGPDRGKDILASPDGFGFKEPRIVVEVKHRQGRMGAPEIRKFLGGRKPHEKGLFVSTGGFTQEANYEAERASIPLTLLDNERLIEYLLNNYMKLDDKTRQILPLGMLYWPL